VILSAAQDRRKRADEPRERTLVFAHVKEDAMKKVSTSVKARAFRGAITASSLIALAVAAGAGRKFI